MSESVPTSPAPLRAVLLDIEGTTTPISFVHQVLFPYARAHLPELVRQADAPGADPAVAACLDAVRAEAPGQDPLAVLLGWMDTDTKATPLKTLQGLVWREGYAAGALHGATYPDVAPALRRWHAAGLGLYIYSSGSVEAQRLIFRHADAGNLSPLLSGYFDTTTGPKRAAASYRAIVASIGLPPGSMLFLSDVAAELDAAAEAGLAVCQLVRPEDGTEPGPRHPVAHDFTTVGARFGLPGSIKGDPR